MKKQSIFNLLVISILGAFLMLSSCDKKSDIDQPAKSVLTPEELGTTFSTVNNALIGYEAEDGSFVNVSKLQLESFIKGLEFISDAGEINIYGVIQGEDAEGNMQYALMIKATDKDQYITSRLNLKKVDQLNFAITEGGCSCSFVGESHESCAPTKVGDCSCTNINNSKNIEKNSTRFSDAKIRTLFK